jgi:hypothetical protein
MLLEMLDVESYVVGRIVSDESEIKICRKVGCIWRDSPMKVRCFELIGGFIVHEALFNWVELAIIETT